MSYVKIEGNASGTGTFTIAAPNSNTDRSITLPDAAGELLLANGDGSNLTGITAGITEADQWRLTADITATSGYITSNLERVDTDGFGLLGTGMTESSGVFTFPSTGYWLLTIFAEVQKDTVADNGIEFNVDTTTNNSSYSAAAQILFGRNDATRTRLTGSTQFLFDVTNTSTHKCKLYVAVSQAASTLFGSTDNNKTGITFIKLGDT
jgi:hypothetical protein